MSGDQILSMVILAAMSVALFIALWMLKTGHY